MRGKLSRELERQKCVQDKRLRCSISRYGLSLSSPLSFHSPASFFFFFFFSSLFRCRLRRKPRTVLRLASIFPYLSRPPHHALCTASASCVKLCAISLTFDNRCSSGNYIPRPRPRIRYSTSCSPSPFKPAAFLCPHLFALDGPSNVIRKKLKSLHREFLHPSRRLDFSSFCAA